MSTLFFVLSNPLEGQADAFNEWYQETHLAEVVALPGVTSAQRYSRADVEGSQLPPGKHEHLAVYEIDGEPTAVLASLMAAMADGSMSVSPSMDMTSVSMGFWDPSGPRVTP